VDRPDSEHQETATPLSPAPEVRPEALQRPVTTRRGGGRLPALLGIAGALCGLAALGVSTWTYFDNRDEWLRIASDVAEIKVSLELYGRNSAAATDTAEAADEGALTDLANRIAILEQNWRDGSTAAIPAPQTPPAAPSTASVSGDDCLPAGMRLLVAAGDSYPICGHPVTVEVSQVDNGFIILSDGTAVASGGAMPLPNSACTIGVTSGGDEGITGFAEIRVTC
jgi:hypothetical protein